MSEGGRGAVVVVVNPRAGGGRGERIVREALRAFGRHGIEPQVVVCSNGGEPGRISRRAMEAGARLVVAAGGDGHAAAVAEGLVGTSTPMAVLPCGSANDYAAALGMPRRDISAAVAAMAAGRTRRVDTIQVASQDGERRFLNVVGTGFDAGVAERAEGVPFLRGAGRYVLAILGELPRLSAATISLTLDGERRELRALMVALANGTSYGGGMRVAPMASLDSGWLEVCVVGEISKVEFLRAFPRVFRGTHVDHPAVTMWHARQVEISADRPLRLLGDGELFGTLPATVSVRPASLSVVVGTQPGYSAST
jgi:diacylglycerol kinase (ATP)